ncbi:MAG: hypothetical protein EZS28_001390 [Streblomastix strix]|uniref:Uncharacterized protein n=1 Tax=Streblomastix strix TaxID=222440 RepID=A0A5J4X994_9EUKA|nr:MAG: hypothetical protein EZS28_001390 [Streblomastix strix]
MMPIVRHKSYIISEKEPYLKQLEKINTNIKKKKFDEKTSEKNDETKESKPLTAKHIFKKYASKFVKKGYIIISEDPKILVQFKKPLLQETNEYMNIFLIGMDG